MLIQCEDIFQEGLDGVEVATDEEKLALGGDDTARPVRDQVRVLREDALTDVVEDLELVDELGALLGVVDAGQHVRVEPVFDPKVTLEVGVVEAHEFILDFLR